MMTVVAAPLAAIMMALLVIDAVRPSQHEHVEQNLYGADLVVNTVADSGHQNSRAQLVRELEELWGERYSIAEKTVVPAVAVTSAGDTTSSHLIEVPPDVAGRLSFLALTSGHFAGAAAEAAVSDSLANELGLSVGSTLQLNFQDDLPITVTGTYRPRYDHTASQIIPGPGTLAEVQALSPPDDPLIYVGAVLVENVNDEPIDPFKRVESERFGQVQTAETVAEIRPFWIRNAGLVAMPALLLLVAAGTAVSVLRARRNMGELTFLWELGAPIKDLRRVLWSEAVVVGIGGMLTGAIVGLAAGILLRGPAARLAFRDLMGSAIQPRDIVILCLLALLPPIIAAFWQTRRLARWIAGSDGVQTGLDAAINPRSGRGWMGPAVAVGSTAVAAALMWTDGPVRTLTVVAGLAALLAVAVAAVLPALWGVLRRRTNGGWLPAGLERGAARRSTAIVIICLAAVALPVGLHVTNQTYNAAALARYEGQFPAGQVDVLLHGRELDDVELAALAQAAGSRPILQLQVASRSQNGTWTSVDSSRPDSTYNLEVVGDPADTAILWNAQLTDAQMAWLDQGKLLAYEPDPGHAIPSTMIVLRRDGDRTIGSVEVASLPLTDPGYLGRGPSAVITAEGAQTLGLPLIPHRLRFLNAIDQSDQIRKAAATLGIAPDAVQVEIGPAPEVDLSFKVVLIVSFALIVLSTGTAARAGIAETRESMRQLLVLGARRRTTLVAGLQLSCLPALCGACAGVVSGIVGAWLAVSTLGIPVSIDWPTMVTMVGLACTAAALANAWQLTRIRGQQSVAELGVGGRRRIARH